MPPIRSTAVTGRCAKSKGTRLRASASTPTPTRAFATTAPAGSARARTRSCGDDLPVVVVRGCGGPPRGGGADLHSVVALRRAHGRAGPVGRPLHEDARADADRGHARRGRRVAGARER